MTPAGEPELENDDDAFGGSEDGPPQPVVQVVLVEVMREVIEADS